MPVPSSSPTTIVLYDDQGNVVGELHGVAQDPMSGQFKSFGRSSDNLHVEPVPGRSGMNLDGQSERTLWQGQGTQERWQAANDAAEAINRRKLIYNFWGSDLNGTGDWDAPRSRVTATRSIVRSSTRWDWKCPACPPWRRAGRTSSCPKMRSMQFEQRTASRGRRAAASSRPPARPVRRSAEREGGSLALRPSGYGRQVGEGGHENLFLGRMAPKNSRPCLRSQALWSHLERDTTLIGNANAENAEIPVGSACGAPRG